MIKKISISILIIITVFILTSCSKVKQFTVDSSVPEKALNISLSYKKATYLFGGRKPPKFDCSGLITYSYKMALNKNNIFYNGNKVVNDATMDMLYNYNVEIISPKNVFEGDIVFVTNQKNKITHGGLFIEWVDKYNTFKFINASSYHGEVVIEKWDIDNKKRDQWFKNFGRLKIPER